MNDAAMYSGPLVANAARALDRYREMERMLEAEVAERLAKLEMVRDFVAALTDKPRQPRRPRTVAEQVAPVPEDATEEAAAPHPRSTALPRCHPPVTGRVRSRPGAMMRTAEAKCWECDGAENTTEEAA